MDLPTDRPMSENELEIAVAEAIVNDRLNPRLDTPFGTSSESLLSRLGIHYHGDYIAKFTTANGSGAHVEMAIRVLCWRWVVAGLLVPAGSGSFSPTPLGRNQLRAVAAGAEVAFTADGAARAVLERCPEASELVLAYVRSAQRCFDVAQHEAALVMLGAATELLVQALADALNAACSFCQLTPSKAIEATTAMRRLDGVVSTFASHSRPLKTAVVAAGGTGAWFSDLPLLLTTANAIRLTRNDAGHPIRLIGRRDEAFAMLTSFPHLAEAMIVSSEDLRLVRA